MEYYKEKESPDIFWYWSAISTLSAIMRDNIYLEVLDDRIYPNIYLVILANSGIYRKASPCRAAAKLIQEVGNTQFIGGRNSIQSAVKEIGENFSNSRGDMIAGASAVLYNEELSTLLVKDEQAVALLTTLYDYHEVWTDTLLSRERVKLEEVCISLLSASNSALFNSTYTNEAIEGGLLGRTLLIKPNEKRPRRSLFKFTKSNLDKKLLVAHLKNLAKIKGPIYYAPDAIRYYDKWYEGIPDNVFEDKIGFGSRLGTHVFKVSLAIATAREDFQLEVELEDVYEAIDVCTALRKNYSEITMGAGMSSRAKQTGLVLQLFLKERSNILSRAVLIQKTLGDIEGEILDSILTYLESAEMLKCTSVTGGQIGYKLTKKAIEMITGDGD